MSDYLIARKVPFSGLFANFKLTPVSVGAALWATLFGLVIPVQAEDLDFPTGWESEGGGDVQVVESLNQVNLSTDNLSDDDFNLGAGSGEFNFSGNPAVFVGFGGLETFLGLEEATQLDLEGVAYEGSAIKTSLTVRVSSELSFDWNFLTNETADVLLPNRGPFKDYGFFQVGQGVNKLADWENTTRSLSCLGFDACTGVQSKSYLLNPGEYTLAFGVIDIDDLAITSALVVRDVTLKPLSVEPTTIPEPNLLFAILTIGGLGTRRWLSKK